MLQKLHHTLEMIKFSHSVFALPFALGSMLIAAGGFPPWQKIIWIIIAVVFARTAAMSFNRWTDAEIDAKNPRTENRHIPQKILSKQYVLSLCILTACGFVFSTFQLGTLCLLLSPIALVILFFYSYTKRFTDFSQIFLGLSLGIAPIGAWIAIRESLSLPPLLLGIAVLFWVAGFDILYATQDEEFDRKNKLRSLVVRWGIPKALYRARLMHFISFLFFIGFGVSSKLGIAYFIGIILMGFLFAYQHSLVKPDDLSRINVAFFTVNGMISFIFLGSVILALYS